VLVLSASRILRRRLGPQQAPAHPSSTHPWARRCPGASIVGTTRQQARREGYLEEFLRFWQANADTRLIWVSMYTPQRGEVSAERLTAADRRRVIEELRRLRGVTPKLGVTEAALRVYAKPPASPAECTFARTTECVSADLERRIVPCQFGGDPDCANCGCLASAGLEAIARHRLPGGIRVGRIFEASLRAGRAVGRLRKAG